MRSQGNSQVCAFVSQRTVFANSVRPATLVVSNEKIREILYDVGEDVVRHLSEVSKLLESKNDSEINAGK